MTTWTLFGRSTDTFELGRPFWTQICADGAMDRDGIEAGSCPINMPIQ